MEGLGAFGRPDDSRCYWTILDQDLRFRYLDPVASVNFGEQLAPFMKTGLYDWIHPEERDAFERDYQNFLTGRTLFGTVTRCRYGRAAHLRKVLGAKAEDLQAHASAWNDDEYMPLKLTSSWIGERTILCFFHAAVDLSEEDADESAQTPWSNWCGPSSDPEQYFTAWHANQLFQVLFDIEASYPADNSEIGSKSRYIFQLLARPSNQLLLSYPHLPEHSDLPEETAESYAKLAREVIERPREQNTDAQTNCTRRYRSKNPVIRHGALTTIESVVIPWGSLSFVGFEIAGTIPNRSPNSASTSQAGYPTIRQDKLPKQKPPPLPFIPSTSGEAHSSGQLSARSRWPEEERWKEAISPTVATGAAILGSFSSQQARAPFPHQPAAPIHHQQQPMPYPQLMQQPRSNTLHPDYYYAHTDPNLEMYIPRPTYLNTHYHPLSYPQQSYPVTTHQEAYYPPPPQYPPVPRQQSASPLDQSPGTEESPQSSTSQLLMPVSAASSATSTASIARKPKRERKDDGVPRTCSSCGTMNSPEWRKGPNGIKSLCNACGLRYARSQARKPKAAASPNLQADSEEEEAPAKKKKKKTATPKATPVVYAQEREPSIQQHGRPMPFGYESGSYPSYPLFENCS